MLIFVVLFGGGCGGVSIVLNPVVRIISLPETWCWIAGLGRAWLTYRYLDDYLNYLAQAFDAVCVRDEEGLQSRIYNRLRSFEQHTTELPHQQPMLDCSGSLVWFKDGQVSNEFRIAELSLIYTMVCYTKYLQDQNMTKIHRKMEDMLRH